MTGGSTIACGLGGFVFRIHGSSNTVQAAARNAAPAEIWRIGRVRQIPRRRAYGALVSSEYQSMRRVPYITSARATKSATVPATSA